MLNDDALVVVWVAGEDDVLVGGSRLVGAGRERWERCLGVRVGGGALVEIAGVVRVRRAWGDLDLLDGRDPV